MRLGEAGLNFSVVSFEKVIVFCLPTFNLKIFASFFFKLYELRF
jgi:hypothetical protein